MLKSEKRQTDRLTFDGEVHGLADIGSNIIADFTQVVAAVLLQNVFDEQRTVLQQLDAGTRVQLDGLELRNTFT